MKSLSMAAIGGTLVFAFVGSADVTSRFAPAARPESAAQAMRASVSPGQASLRARWRAMATISAD